MRWLVKDSNAQVVWKASSHTLSTLLSYMKDTSTYRQDTPRKLVGGQIAFGIGLRLHEGKKNLGGDFETLYCKS